MSVKLGDAETKKLTSGRFYFKKSGETNWRDLGNVIDYKPDWKVTRQEHMSSSGGIKRIDFAAAKEINPKFMFTVDEHTPDLEELIILGTQGADDVQAAGNTAAEQLTDDSLKGRTYFTAKQGLSAVVVKVAAVAQTLDTDYALDAGSGAITILADGGIADGSTVTVDYTAAEVTQSTYTAFDDLETEGDCKIVEKDQFSLVPRQITTFFGQLYVTSWGENNLSDFNKIGLEAIPLNAPVITTRKD